MEWSAESIQATVKRLGVLAPLGFLALVTLRQFMALPSVLVLTSAGLLFGAGGAAGTLIGGLGMTLNALFLFTTVPADGPGLGAAAHPPSASPISSSAPTRRDRCCWPS